jgi:glutamate decarboxylase
MEDEAEKLMAENMSKNFIDYEEYPSTVLLHNRCVNMIARLFNAPVDNPEAESLGVSTIGSSEAIILSVLAMKKRWQKKRKAEGKDWHNPNLVMSSAVQVCWEKATRYLEVEEKFVNVIKDRYVIDPEEAAKLCDENTIGCVAILGTTYTGQYEDVEALCKALDKRQADEGLDVPVHVDAASGGFVVPFINPNLVWDFRLPRVVSINVSGHKYGLTYAGVGWALWRSPEYLPEELVFHVNYLGADQASFTLNFSKGAAQVVAQYYVLIRHGRSGFRAIMGSITQTADFLAASLEESGYFTIMSEGSGAGLPLVAFRLKEKKHYDEFAIAAKLREKGWIVPAYTMAPNAQDLKLLRVVCRADMSRSRCELLLRDIMGTLKYLDSLPGKVVEVMMDHTIEHKKKHHRRRHAHKPRKDHSLQGETGKTHGIC